MSINKYRGDNSARIFVGKSFCALVFAVCAAICAVAQQKHPFQFDDSQKARSAAPIAVAPDGKTILYRVNFGVPQGVSKTEWLVIDANGGNSHLLKLAKNFEPIGFTKDGAHLYGTFGEEKKPAQLALEPLKGGKPKLLTNIAGGVSEANISPDGARFAALANPRSPDPLADVRTIVQNERRSIYLTNADGSGGAWWCPTLVHVDAIAWAPDRQRLAVLSGTPKIGHHEVHSFIDVCDANGPKRLAEIPNASNGIEWTNGGKEIVFLSTTTNVLTPDHVWTIAAEGGAPVDRTPALKGSAVGLAGDAHGKIWIAVARGVQIDADTFTNDALSAGYQWPHGIVRRVVSPEMASAPGTAVFSVADPTHMANLALAENGSLRKITNEGDAELANVAFGEVRTVNWTSKEGIHLQGIVTFPGDYVTGKKYPFLVLPHGGPESNDALALDSFSRTIAGMGYVVMQPQYRGSTGYGSDFLNAIYQHFGDRAYEDVDSATDYAIEQGWADPQRLAIFGWSAGGFMTSWTVTQTHRYRAAIEGAGITDWLSFIPTSDIAQVDYDARWSEEGAEPFLKFSAVMFADKVTTPLLILHGAADPRVPTFQGREYFILLAERGKTVKMVTYPGSPHFPPRWEQRRDIFEQIKTWLEKYNP